jgi:hypothetical protein
MSKKGIEIEGSENLTLYKYETHIEIVHTWLSGTTVVVTAFAFGFLIVSFGAFLSLPHDTGGTILFLLSFGSLSAYLMYNVLAKWINRTYISISPNRIDIHHRPLPWLGNKTIEISGLTHLYTQVDDEGDASRSYIVQAITQSHGTVNLIDCQSSKQAHQIELAVAQYLNIPATSPSLIPYKK